MLRKPTNNIAKSSAIESGTDIPSVSEPAPLYVINSQLNKTEFSMGRTFLESQPSYLTIVLGNGCNIDCPHCYQEKNGDNLLRDKEIGFYLRREFSQLYPYLETLRLQGGEVFALKGFSELVTDVASSVDRPLISISTNGTLLNDTWCRQIVEIPFQAVTFSFDAGTKKTFERLRRGAKFDVVVNNITRLQEYKLARKSWFPNLDAFFVVMRSNFREIPLFMELMLKLQIYEVSFQTILVDDRNLQREPQLYKEEIVDPAEIMELYDLLKKIVKKYSDVFDVISFSGLQSLFESIGLSSDFLDEKRHTLTPGLDKYRRQRSGLKQPQIPQYELSGEADNLVQQHIDRGQCINPWSTLFVTENGDLSLCFLSEPVGNLYSTPLVKVWNSTAAVAKRSDMLAGNFTQSGCSSLWCNWRDSDGAQIIEQKDWHKSLMNFNVLVAKLLHHKTVFAEPVDTKIKAIRRLIKSKDRRIDELESNLMQLWEDNAEIHKKGQEHIHYLEVKISNLEAEHSWFHRVRERWVKKQSVNGGGIQRRLTGISSLIQRFVIQLKNDKK